MSQYDVMQQTWSQVDSLLTSLKWNKQSNPKLVATPALHWEYTSCDKRFLNYHQQRKTAYYYKEHFRKVNEMKVGRREMVQWLCAYQYMFLSLCFFFFLFSGWKLWAASCPLISAAPAQARLLSDDSNNSSPSLQMEHFDGLCSVNLHRAEHIWINVDLRFTERWGRRVKVIHNCMQMLGTFRAAALS